MAFIQCDFFSEVLGMATSINAILPIEPQAAAGIRFLESDKRQFPCLLLLHGLSDDHTIWHRRTSIERHVAHLGLAVVMPNVHRSFYADMKHGPSYWTFISEELPECARAMFRLSDRREDNFVAGNSMGGYGAFKLALHHPGRFAAAASLSGALDLATTESQADSSIGRDFQLIFGEDAAISGSDDDLFACAEKAARGAAPVPALYQCCGKSDFLYADNLRFRDHALSLNLDLTYEEGSGEHEWGYWDRQIQRVLKWLPVKHPVMKP